MSTWLLIDFAVFAVVIIVTGIIIPQILLIAFRKKLFDEIDPRKIHKGAVPRLGGIAFFPAILFALLLVFGVCSIMEESTIYLGLSVSFRSFCFVTCAVITLYLVGMADDLIGLKYRAKFIAQILAACMVIAGGILLDNLHGFLTIDSLLPYTSISHTPIPDTSIPHTSIPHTSIPPNPSLPAPSTLIPLAVASLLTILLTVFITNAINLIDGIDGLASGLSAIACAFYGVMFYTADLHFFAMLAFATLGALIPFFYYNVFGNAGKHSKIFMGDTGALTVGLILSVLSIRLCMIDKLEDNINPAVVAFAPLLIPCFDVVRVYLHRIRKHRNPFLPDKTHIHHKLLALGIHQRLAMPLIVASSILLTLLNYFLSRYIDITLLFILDLLLWISVNMLLTRAIHEREKRLNTILYD